MAPITEERIIASITTTATEGRTTAPVTIATPIPKTGSPGQTDNIVIMGGAEQRVDGKPLHVVVLAGRSKVILFYVPQSLMKEHYHVGIFSVHLVLEGGQDDQNSQILQMHDGGIVRIGSHSSIELRLGHGIIDEQLNLDIGQFTNRSIRLRIVRLRTNENWTRWWIGNVSVDEDNGWRRLWVRVHIFMMFYSLDNRVSVVKFHPRGTMETDQIIEQVSAKVHEDWMKNKLANGVTSRTFAETGEELMVPYEQLTEKAKDADRSTVRTTIKALESLGFLIVEKP